MAPGRSWSETETQLAEAMIAGIWLDLRDRIERRLGADAIRDLLRGLLPPRLAAARVDPRGLRVRGGVIEHRLDLDNLDVDLPLTLEDCELQSGLSANDAGLRSLCLDGSTVHGTRRPAIDAAGLTIAHNVTLRRLSADSDDPDHAVIRLVGARIGGQLIAPQLTLRNQAGQALSASRMTVAESVWLTQLQAEACSTSGAVTLIGATIGGRMNTTEMSITNSLGPALDLDRLEVRQSVDLSKLKAAGGGSRGAIQCYGTRVNGQLRAPGVTAGNRDSGPALAATRLEVGLSLTLDGLTATSAGSENATVRLLGIEVGASLLARDMKLENSGHGPALNTNGSSIAGRMSLDGLTAVGGAELGTVRLLNTAVGHGLVMSRLDVHNVEHPHAEFDVDGLTYGGFPEGVSRAEWLGLLSSRTAAYAAQPYRQLAAAASAAGHDRETAEVLMAQRRDQLDRAETSREEWLWGRFTGWLLGYGYRPSRALRGLVAAVVLSLIFTLTVGPLGLMVKDSGVPGRRCATADLVVLAVDTAVPLVDSGVADRCVPRPIVAGEWMSAGGLVVQLIGWAFATLFVAGFTGAVRRT